MSPQPTSLRSADPHLHFPGATCPTCDQPVANEKFAEITAKLAAREQQMASSVRGQVERDYATRFEKLANDNAAAVEKLKQEAIDREATVRREVEASLEEKMAEAAQKRQAAEDANVAIRAELQVTREAAETALA